MKLAAPYVALVVALGCGHTRNATYVQLREEGGANTYVAGAAGSGLSQSLACHEAVTRAVEALAEKFADENQDTGKELKKDLGVEDGRPLLYRYARGAAIDAAVQDVSFDPIEHLCMATIRWRPPVFVRDAVVAYAAKLRESENAAGSPAAVPAPTAPAPQPAPAPVAPPRALVWDASAKYYQAKVGDTNATVAFSVTNTTITNVVIRSVRTSCALPQLTEASTACARSKSKAA